MPGLFIAAARSGRRLYLASILPQYLPMTAHEWMELCIDLFRYLIGPVLRTWITARIDAKPKRNRNASRKTSR